MRSQVSQGDTGRYNPSQGSTLEALTQWRGWSKFFERTGEGYEEESTLNRVLGHEQAFPRNRGVGRLAEKREGQVHRGVKKGPASQYRHVPSPYYVPGAAVSSGNAAPGKVPTLHALTDQEGCHIMNNDQKTEEDRPWTAAGWRVGSDWGCHPTGDHPARDGDIKQRLREDPGGRIPGEGSTQASGHV